ncbi:hypothetical protein JCM33374_g6119 [Metschnikowia sp. JCM 33374]|nr:hypothetical protein JCM33374_g6119 [Metschnikowia sp. JCM 33374]
MKSLGLFSLFAAALATQNVDFGVLSMTSAENEYGQSLIVVTDKIFISDRMTVFRYDANSKILRVSPGKYLGINQHGKLAIENAPQYGFHVDNTTATRWLKYHGDGKFYTCADKQVGTKGTCAGAREVSIFFEPFAWKS